MATAQSNPITHQPAETLEEKFRRLATTWQKAVAHLSSSSRRDNHPAYQEIISLGPPVIPFLLRDLEGVQRHWFTALTAITGENPVPEKYAGDILKMVEAWLEWGKAKGYRW
jgi:hypothetical protein